MKKEKDWLDFFLDDVKNGSITTNNKKSLCDIILNLENVTTFEKRRFLKFYNLVPDQSNDYTLKALAEEENCTEYAIKRNILKIKNSIKKINKFKDKAECVRIINDCRNGRY